MGLFKRNVMPVIGQRILCVMSGTVCCIHVSTSLTASYISPLLTGKQSLFDSQGGCCFSNGHTSVAIPHTWIHNCPVILITAFSIHSDSQKWETGANILRR